MQELNPEEVEQVGGGLSMYYTPPPPTSLNLGEIQTRAPGSYDDPTSWEWNV